jgi:hypothetical protein
MSPNPSEIVSSSEKGTEAKKQAETPEQQQERIKSGVEQVTSKVAEKVSALQRDNDPAAPKIEKELVAHPPEGEFMERGGHEELRAAYAALQTTISQEVQNALKVAA